MSFTGQMRDGVVVFPVPVPIPEGAAVEVAVREASNSDAVSSETSPRTHYEIFKEFIGSIPDLPEDMAENHDHYIHGTPKK